MQGHRKLMTICAAAVLTLGLAACGGGGDDDDTAMVCPAGQIGTYPDCSDPPPTPYQAATAAIATATTAEAAQAAYDAVKDDVTGAQGDMLQAAVNARIEALAMMARAAEQKTALATAAGAIDTSDLTDADAIVAANSAIAALKAALAAAADVSDADKAMYQSRLEEAETEVMTAQDSLDTAGRQVVQRSAITDAVAAARTAVGMVDDDATDGQVTAADNAIAALRAAISGAADLPEGDTDVAVAQGTLDTLTGQLTIAKASRTAAIAAAAAEAEEQRKMAAISTAQTALTSAQDALAALADDATDEEKRDAHRAVEAAANGLRDALQMNDGSAEAIETAIRTAHAAKLAADALQATITAAAETEKQRKMTAISTAQTALTNAQTALAALGEDATDKEKRDAHRAVERAAADLVQVLEDNDGTEAQIATATSTRDSAKTMADDLTSPIEIADQRKAITDALAALATAVAAIDDESTDAEVKAADDAIAAARKAIADADALSDREKSLSTQLVDNQVTTLASAKASRKIVVDAAEEKKQMEAKVAANKVAATKRAAITAEATPPAAGTETAASRPFDRTGTGSEYAPLAAGVTDQTTNDGQNYRVVVEHDGGPKVTVTDGNLEAKSDPMFVKEATFGDGQMLVRNVGTEREIIVLHTDIEADTATPFSRAPGVDLDQDTDPDHTGNESIRIQSTETADNYFDGMASSRFMHSGDADTHTITFRIANPSATPPVAASKFSGTYDGAPGTYECTGSTVCTVTVNDKDEVTAVVGDWNFTPNAGATVAVADDDYMTYGFWLDTTTKDGAISSYDAVQTFATSSLATAGALSTVTGSAEYAGGAAGVYVHETKKEDGTIDTATSGRFTADVALSAYFDGTTAPFADNSIHGTISNFDLDGGPENSWGVDVVATIDDAGTLSSGTAKGGVTGQNGSFTGTFHGPDPDTAGTDAPAVLVGEFNANFVNGAVAGAYGTRKQP